MTEVNKHQNNRNDEYYEEDADYYYNNALKVNTKHDAGSTRIKRTPFSQLTTESEIPEKPKEIIVEPNEKHYDKLIKEVDDKIQHHNKSMESIREKIESERVGNNPEIKRLKEEKDNAITERAPILKKIEELEKKVIEPKRKLQDLKSEKESIQRDLDFTKIEALDAEVRAIQHKLGFSSLSISEEKKMIDKKNRIEAQRVKVERYTAIIAESKKVREENDKLFAELKTLNEKKRSLNEKVKTATEKLKIIFENKSQNDPTINNLKLQRDNIKDERDKCYLKKEELNNEYYQKLNQFRDQMRLLDYISKAEEKVAFLKKKEEREKKRKERELAQNQALQEEEKEETTDKVDEDPFAYQIWVCEWLSNYFRNTLGINKENNSSTLAEVTQTKNQNSKIDDDISKGLIKQMQNKDDEFSIGLSTASAPKKKTKGPKVSKREQKCENSNILVLDISIIKKIQDLKLSPPALKTELTNFINLLTQTADDFKKQSETIKKGVQSEIKETPEVSAKEAESKDNDATVEETIKITPKVTSHDVEDVEEYEEVEITEEVEEEEIEVEDHPTD